MGFGYSTKLFGGGGTGGGGITNGAGANVLAKSDGTNIVASALTEASAGAIATTAGTALSLTATAPAATTGASQVGKAVGITASPAVASTDTNGAAAGGAVNITTGDAARRVSGTAAGGWVNLVLGNGAAGGYDYTNYGALHFQFPNEDGSYKRVIKATQYGFAMATSPTCTASLGVYGGNNVVVVGDGGALAFDTAQGLGDTYLRRKAAGSVAWGLAAASPVAYTHTLAADARSGTDTNVRGANATLTPGIGTGTGGSGDFALQTAPAAASGTTANVPTSRVYLYSLAKTLTDGSATGLFEVALPSGSHVGVTVEATVSVENATDYQTRRVSMNLSAHNKAATVTSSTPTEYGASALLDSGTLTTAWTVTNGTGKITVNLNADSDLGTQTRIDVRYEVRVDGDAGTLVTPL